MAMISAPMTSAWALAFATMSATVASGVAPAASAAARSYCVMSMDSTDLVVVLKVKSTSVRTLPYSRDCAYGSAASATAYCWWESPPKRKST